MNTRTHQPLLDFIADLREAGVTSYAGPWGMEHVSFTIDLHHSPRRPFAGGGAGKPIRGAEDAGHPPRKLTDEEAFEREAAEYIPGAD